MSIWDHMKKKESIKMAEYYVWNTTGGAPRFKHASREEATTEASRLAKLNRGMRFVVLKVISSYTAPRRLTFSDIRVGEQFCHQHRRLIKTTRIIHVDSNDYRHMYNAIRLEPCDSAGQHSSFKEDTTVSRN
jgi:hypothetical protein